MSEKSNSKNPQRRNRGEQQPQPAVTSRTASPNGGPVPVQKPRARKSAASQSAAETARPAAPSGKAGRQPARRAAPPVGHKPAGPKAGKAAAARVAPAAAKPAAAQVKPAGPAKADQGGAARQKRAAKAAPAKARKAAPAPLPDGAPAAAKSVGAQDKAAARKVDKGGAARQKGTAKAAPADAPRDASASPQGSASLPGAPQLAADLELLKENPFQTQLLDIKQRQSQARQAKNRRVRQNPLLDLSLMADPEESLIKGVAVIRQSLRDLLTGETIRLVDSSDAAELEALRKQLETRKVILEAALKELGGQLSRLQNRQRELGPPREVTPDVPREVTRDLPRRLAPRARTERRTNAGN